MRWPSVLFIVLLAVAAVTTGDEARVGNVIGEQAGEVDPYPPPTQVPSLGCFSTGLAGGSPPFAYQLNIGSSIGPGPTYFTAIGTNAFALKPDVPDPATYTKGDPDTWIYRCMTSGGTVDRSSPPGGATYGNVSCLFSCADVGFFDLEIWATNSVGSDFCNPGFIQIADPNGLCGGP